MPDAALEILVVEDDNALREWLAETLELAHYAVRRAPNGVVALQELAGKSCDLVITDISMPGMSGIDLLNELRARMPDIPVIIMTAYGSLDTAVLALRQGAYDYVTKPFDIDVLLAAVARAAERQQLRRQLEHQRQLEVVSKLALTIGHQINNPLLVIMGLVQLHLDEQVLPAAVMSDMRQIEESARRISESIQRITQLRKLIGQDSGVDGTQMLDIG